MKQAIVTVFALLGALTIGSFATALAALPLPSWNDGAPKNAIVTFVQSVSAKGSGTFVPPPERIAVFDNDGTLWAEQPMYFQALFIFDRGGNNLHRNVLFRDNKDKADQILPFSAWQSEDPEKLWEWMAKYEQKTGGKVLAIPHNGNLSNGRMFELVDFAGNPLSRDYAERRARWEVLQEVMQTKGNSETHPTLSPNDEFANFGIQGWDNGNLTLEDKPETRR